MKFGGKTLAIVGLIVLVMGLEAAVIYWLIPPRGEATVQAAGAHGEEQPSSESEADPHKSTVEVSLDSFNCTNSRGGSGSIMHVSFRVTAIVARDQQTKFEETANNEHKTRVKQAIEKVTRSLSLEDLNDPNLSTMKRLIREEINKLLGKSYVTEVVISDFRTIEQ